MGLSLAWFALSLPATTQPVEDSERWAKLHEHAVLSRDCARFCKRLLAAWAVLAEPSTGLLPERHDSYVWTPENSAADLYAWLTLAADWAGDDADRRRMRHLLAAELALTTRRGSFPDAVHLDDLAFYHAELRGERLIIGASEYAKDGLLPIVEALGPSPWSDRLISIADDLARVDGELTPWGPIPSRDAEVNGEVLQTLSRAWHFTGNQAYSPMIERIVRAYVELVAESTGGLPCQRFDFMAREPVEVFFALHDHGNEILGGLVEATLVLRVTNPALCRQLQRYLKRVFAMLTEHAVKPDGTFVAQVDARTGEVLDDSTRDTSAYVLLAFLAWSELDPGEDYRLLVSRGLAALVGGAYDEWPNPDAYADAIESVVLLMSRLPSRKAEEFAKRGVRRLLASQHAGGLVDGGYGDGNAARTARLVGRWLRAGTSLEPPRDDLLLGAVFEGATLHAVLAAESDYLGTWRFDHPRHRRWMRMPMNLPRLNEDPEWFTVEGDEWYAVTFDGGLTRLALGSALREGLPIELVGGKARRVRVLELGPTPEGGLRIHVAGPRAVAQNAQEVELGLSHDLPFELVIEADAPLPTGKLLDLQPGKQRRLRVPLPPVRTTPEGIETWQLTFFDSDRVMFGRWTGHRVANATTLDIQLFRGDAVTDGLAWRAVGEAGLELDLELPGDGTRAEDLELRWLVAGELAGQEAVIRFEPDQELQAGTRLRGEQRWAVAPVPEAALHEGRVRAQLFPASPDQTLRIAAVALCRKGRVAMDASAPATE